MFGPRYQPIRQLGAGGAGEVYLVEDLEAGGTRAIKMLYDTALVDPDMRTRFLTEARILRELSHPHVLAFVEDGTLEGGELYVVMEYADGGTLAEWIEIQPKPPVYDGIRLLIEVLGALQHAHDKRIIHRDVKPDNILLVDGHARLADFGIARFDRPFGNAGVTNTGDHLGTLGYMAPEQRLDARHASAASDVYGAGATLYTILTQDPRPPPALYEMDERDRLLDRIPPDIRHILLRATRYHPADRYGKASQMADALALSSTFSSAAAGTGSG